MAAAVSRHDPNPTSLLCPKCKTSHKRGAKCPNDTSYDSTPNSVFSHLTPLKMIKTRDELRTYVTEAKKMTGVCPSCKKPHTFEREFDFGGIKEKAHVPSHRLDNCSTFKNLTPNARGQLIQEIKGCWSCLDWLHSGDDCRMKNKPKCDVSVGPTTCNGVHHKLLHDTGVAYCHLTQPKNLSETYVLFDIQQIDPVASTIPANTLLITVPLPLLLHTDMQRSRDTLDLKYPTS